MVQISFSFIPGGTQDSTVYYLLIAKLSAEPILKETTNALFNHQQTMSQLLWPKATEQTLMVNNATPCVTNNLSIFMECSNMAEHFPINSLLTELWFTM